MDREIFRSFFNPPIALIMQYYEIHLALSLVLIDLKHIFTCSNISIKVFGLILVRHAFLPSFCFQSLYVLIFEVYNI